MSPSRNTPAHNIAVELCAVIVSVVRGQPQVLVADGLALPSGPFETGHTKLQQGLKAWVTTSTGLDLDYIEQLYTFADKDREGGNRRFVSIGYLALVHNPDYIRTHAIQSVDWYKFFPWEDHRKGVPEKILSVIQKNLSRWKNEAADTATRRAREARIAVTFPKDPHEWNEELVLQRYELLWEAGLIEEAQRDHKTSAPAAIPGLAMAHDHRRILATGIARLRAKIKYRPVVFELMPPHFTLLELQNTVEALAGLPLHKQNFRRLVQGQGLVEETESQSLNTKGRPAKLFAFRREVLGERAMVGTKLPRSR